MRDPELETTDELLCRRFAAGDRGAFDELVERHRDPAYRLAWSILRDAEEARDLAQEAFLRVFEKAATFDGRRQRLLQRYERMKSLPPGDRAQLMQNWERFRQMSPEERQKLRERWRGMSPEERRKERERLGGDGDLSESR